MLLTKQDLQDLNKYPHLECHVQNHRVEMGCEHKNDNVHFKLIIIQSTFI